jgi:hypothetical protein
MQRTKTIIQVLMLHSQNKNCCSQCPFHIFSFFAFDFCFFILLLLTFFFLQKNFFFPPHNILFLLWIHSSTPLFLLLFCCCFRNNETTSEHNFFFFLFFRVNIMDFCFLFFCFITFHFPNFFSHRFYSQFLVVGCNFSFGFCFCFVNRKFPCFLFWLLIFDKIFGLFAFFLILVLIINQFSFIS